VAETCSTYHYVYNIFPQVCVHVLVPVTIFNCSNHSYGSFKITGSVLKHAKFSFFTSYNYANIQGVSFYVSDQDICILVTAAVHREGREGTKRRRIMSLVHRLGGLRHEAMKM
jgi:hypothetical protein